MVKNHKLALSISDVSWSKFVSYLKYKADWNGRELVFVDRFYPSSKTCSNCGSIKKDLTLAVRDWICDSCNFHHDRDVNAAINIRNEGLNIRLNSR